MLMRVTKYLFLFFLVGCSNSSNLQSREAIQPNWPYFWKIEKEGKTFYILGTMHITVSLDELPCPNNIKDKLKNSDLVFSEFSNTWTNILKKEKLEETDEELNHLYTQNGFDLIYSEDDSYFTHLSIEAQKFFREKGVSNKLSYAGYMVARDALCFTEAYGDASVQKSLDKDIIETAKSENISIKPLDTPELRNQLFSSIHTLEAVESAVKSFPECPGNVAHLSHNYKSGNMPQSNFSDIFIQVALKDRNQEWLAKFLSAHTQYNSIFIAAGTTHFTGPSNLLEMLRNEGFIIHSSTCRPE